MLDQNLNEINHDASPWTPAMKYGVIWGLLGVVIILAQYFTGALEAALTGETNAMSFVWGALGLIIPIFCIYKAISDHKADRGDNISLGGAFGVGLRTSLIYGVIAAIWTFVFYTFVFTGYGEIMQEMLYTQFDGMGMSEDEIENAMSMSGAFSSVPFMSGAAFVMALIIGGIISLIIGAIKKNA